MSRTHRRRHRDTPRHVAQIRDRRPRPAAKPAPQGRAPVAPDASPHITDHAVLRWMERVHGIDLRTVVETEINAGGRVGIIARIGTGRLKLAQPNVVLMIRGGVVVSVLPGDA